MRNTKKGKKIVALLVALLTIASTSLLFADDTGGGSGSGGQGGGFIGGSDWGMVYVWFDDSEHSQGEFSNGDSDVSDVSWNKFIDLLSQEISAETGKTVTPDFTYRPERWAKLRQDFKEACQNALDRSTDKSQKARVVGVATTYNVLQDTTNWYIGAQVQGSYNHSYVNMFGNKPADTSSSSNPRHVLPENIGWSDTVDVTKHNSAYTGESWRDYVYRIGNKDAYSGNGDEWQVYVVAVTENMPPQNGEVTLKKTSTDSRSLNNSQYSLEGAKYGVYETRANANSGSNSVGTLTTKADGSANTLELPAGTYYVKETSASKNYELDATVYEITVESGGKVTVNSKETPKPAKVNLKKVSTNTSISNDNKCYSLEGAKYGVYATASAANNGSPLAKDIDGKDAILTTKADGATNTLEMIGGNYVVKEISPSKGFKLDTVSHTVTLEPGKTATVDSKEEPQGEPIEIVAWKKDDATSDGKAQGAATLKGAEFTVKYYDVEGGTADSVKSLTPKRTWKFLTDNDGRIRLNSSEPLAGSDALYVNNGKRVFLVGTYTIQETGAPEGYLLNNTITHQNITWKNDGELEVRWHEPTLETALAEHVKRGDFQGVKIFDSSNKRGGNIPFLITAKSTGEKHIVVTDPNGQFTTIGDKGGNANDEGILDADGNVIYDENGMVDMSKVTLASTANRIWFNGRNDESVGAPEADSDRALPYDTYYLQELRCESNKGMELLGTTIEEGEDENGIKVLIYRNDFLVNLGTLTNDFTQVPSIATTAVDKETETHMSDVTQDVTIVDTVEYKNLKAGETYTMKGTLMDKATGEPMKADGKDITAETTFEAKEANGTVEIEFTFKDVTLAGKTAVAFEELYKDDAQIAVHADLEDADQTVYFPEIKTKADLKDLAKVVDTVNYYNLIPGQKYVMEATMVDADGKTIEGATGSTEFTPKAANGTVEVEIDAANVIGKAVAYEKCTLNGKVVGRHEDPTDEAQTVTVSNIGTKAAQTDLGTIVDIIYFEGLTPGTEYTFKGTLMDKETGESTGVEAEAKFTPEEANGETQVTFEITDDIRGKSVVAFEQAYDGDKLVAKHEDLNDKEQTVDVPKIGTKANVDDKGMVRDTVEYTNLTPGKEYTMTLVLVDKQTGKSTGITASTKFTPDKANGKVDVEVDASKLVGQTVVAFEECYLDDTLVAEHKDINDAAQTVTIPSHPAAPVKNTPKTGDMIMLAALMAVLGTAGVVVARRRKTN